MLKITKVMTCVGLISAGLRTCFVLLLWPLLLFDRWTSNDDAGWLTLRWPSLFIGLLFIIICYIFLLLEDRRLIIEIERVAVPWSELQLSAKVQAQELCGSCVALFLALSSAYCTKAPNF